MKTRTQDPWVGDHLPNALQTLLLQAACLSGEEAGKAWETWRAEIDFERIDTPSVRMLPLLHHNLNQHGLENDPLWSRMSGVTKLGWAKSQVARTRLEEMKDLLSTWDRPPVLLGEACYASQYYPSQEACPIGRLDLWVGPEIRENLFAPFGWRPRRPSSERQVKLADGLELHHEQGGPTLFIRWHLSPDRIGGHLDTSFYSSAQLAADTPWTFLPPTEQLVLICIQGAHWKWDTSFCWVADALQLLKRKGNEIDWTQVETWTREFEWVVTLGQTLGYLAAEWNAPIPHQNLDRIKKQGYSARERKAYRALTRNYFQYPGSYPNRLWCQYVHHLNVGTKPTPWGFLAYLRDLWGLNSITSLAKEAFRRWREGRRL